MIWKYGISLDVLNNMPEYMGTFLGIEFTEYTDNSLTATMPVTSKTKQPFGLLHGGASVVLAESLGSCASAILIDQTKYSAVGLEINANHLRSVRSGIVKGVATPIRLGRTSHVWDIKIYDEKEKMVCVSRLTVAVIKK